MNFYNMPIESYSRCTAYTVATVPEKTSNFGPVFPRTFCGVGEKLLGLKG